MFAVRFGNIELAKYFKSINMRPELASSATHISIVGCAIYSGEYTVLEYVLDELKISPNPQKSESPPIKLALKASNIEMTELLVRRGAYYKFQDVCNNF